MSLFSIVFLCLFMGHDVNPKTPLTNHTKVQNLSAYHTTIDDIDSMDRVVFNLDLIQIDGYYVTIPVYIISDDPIFSLDFSMLLDTTNIKFESVIDNSNLDQYFAHLNMDDLKLRFTSNSFTPYPHAPQIVIYLRFKVLSSTLYKSDFQMLIAYLNGEKCSVEFQLQGEEIAVANPEIITNEIFIKPNPASDYFFIDSEGPGTLDMFDEQGKAVIRGYTLRENGMNSFDVQLFPRGIYTIRIVSKDHTVKTQKIVLQ